MSAIELKVELEERPPLTLVGIKTRTNMESALTDCPRHWEEFMPRMSELAAGPAGSYGVSFMVNETEFDYWAALPLKPGAPVPPGLAGLDVPGGLYASCRLLSLENMSQAYERLYSQPLPGYEARLDAPCYEFYPPDFQGSGPLTIYVPVHRKD